MPKSRAMPSARISSQNADQAMIVAIEPASRWKRIPLTAPA